MLISSPFKTKQPQYVSPSKTNQHYHVLIYPNQETLEKLNEHLKRLESGELNKRNGDERKGVSSEDFFDFVNIDHYVMPTLHLMLGIVNYLYKKMVEEAQAAFEGYSMDYVEAEGYGNYQSTTRQQKIQTKKHFRLQMNNTKGN